VQITVNETTASDESGMEHRYNLYISHFIEALMKWFYDISVVIIIRAIHCGSLLEGLRSHILQLWMKQRGHDNFTWFRPSERNTLCSRDEFVLLCAFFKLALNWHKKI
jgi:hypothetical protein